MLYDSTYMKHLEQANSLREKIDQSLPGAGEMGLGDAIVKWIQFLFEVMRNFRKIS